MCDSRAIRCLLQRFVAVAGPKASENDVIQTSPLTAFIILKGGTREKLPPRTDMRSQQPFILSRGRGVRLEFYPGCFLSCLSTLRRNPLLSESDRRGFSPKITNAPPPHLRLLGGDGRGGGEGARAGVDQCKFRCALFQRPPRSVLCSPARSQGGDGSTKNNWWEV